MIVDWKFAEPGDAFRPAYRPRRRGDKVALVHAIPGFNSHFDREQENEDDKAQRSEVGGKNRVALFSLTVAS